MCSTRVGGLDGDFSAFLDAPYSSLDSRAKTTTLNNTWLSVLVLPILISFVIGAILCYYGKGRCKECWRKRRGEGGGGGGVEDDRGGGDARCRELVAVAESRSPMLTQRAEKMSKDCDVVCSKLERVQEREIQRPRNQHRHQQPQQQIGSGPQNHLQRTQGRNNQQQRRTQFQKEEPTQRNRMTQHSPNVSHNSPLLGANACPLDSDISVENSGYFDVNACPLDSEVSVHKQEATSCALNSDVSVQNTGPFSVNTCPLDSEISVQSRHLITVRRKLRGNAVVYQTTNTLQTTQQNQMAEQQGLLPGLELRHNKDDSLPSCYSQKQHHVAQWLSSLQGACQTFHGSSVSCKRGFVDRFGSHKFKTSFTTANRTSHLGYKSISPTTARKHRTRRCSNRCRHDCVTGSLAVAQNEKASSQSKDHESYEHSSKLKKDSSNRNPNPLEEISNPNPEFGYKHGCGQRINGDCAHTRQCSELEQTGCNNDLIGDHSQAHVAVQEEGVSDVRFCPNWRQLSSRGVYGKNRLASSLHKGCGFQQPLQDQLQRAGNSCVNKEERRIHSLQTFPGFKNCAHKDHGRKKPPLGKAGRSRRMIPLNIMCGGDFGHSVQLALRHLEDRTTQGTDSGATQPCTHLLTHHHRHCHQNRPENHHRIIQNHRQRQNGESHPPASGSSHHYHHHHHHNKHDHHRHHHNRVKYEDADHVQCSRGVPGSPQSRQRASATVTSPRRLPSEQCHSVSPVT